MPIAEPGFLSDRGDSVRSRRVDSSHGLGTGCTERGHRDRPLCSIPAIPAHGSREASSRSRCFAWVFAVLWLSSAALFTAILALGGGWHHHSWNDLAADDLSWGASETPRPAWVRGVIKELLGTRTVEGYGAGDPPRVVTRLVVTITGICDGSLWRGASGQALVSVVGDRDDLYAGEPVELAGQIAQVAGPLNPGEFDYRAYLRAQGIRLRISVDNPAGVSRDAHGSEWPWTRRLGRLRALCRARLVGPLDSRTAPLASALILGQREDIDPEVNDAFARTGTTHLLAISGLQIQVLAYALGLVLRLIGLPRLPAYGGVALATIGYAILVGLAPSVVRSAVMTLTFCVAAMVGRPTRPSNTLALAGVLTLAWNPFFLFDVGCQLSFLAIGALDLAGTRGSEKVERAAHVDQVVPLRHNGAPGGVAAPLRAVVVDPHSSSRCLDRGGFADLGGHLAGGRAAGRVLVSSCLADRHPAEHSAHPDNLPGPVAWCRGHGARPALGPSRRAADGMCRSALAADRSDRPLGCSAVVGPSIRARSFLGNGRGLLLLADAGDDSRPHPAGLMLPVPQGEPGESRSGVPW